LSRYVREGGGLAGHHGAGRASSDWPEMAEILGARAGAHAIPDEKVTVKLDDPKSPINAVFGGRPFEITDEFFRPAAPYSREKLHVLLSFDVEKTEMDQSRDCAVCAREDNDYAISWIHNYGKGRVFYSTLGHNPGAFWNSRILEHFLAGIQFILGDLKADTTPSARLAARK
jgi:type 1 glutamine amidotransferase